MPCWSSRGGASWIHPTAVLCVYGFLSMMRPAEPFLTPFLTGTFKNLTVHQVSRDIFPVWAYSNLVLLIPALLVTDFLKYKPVVVLQALAYVVTWLLLLFGSGVRSAQGALFVFSIASAADVGYYSYIYSVVSQEHYQRVTSYARGAALLGYGVGSLLGQILVSFGKVSLYGLNIITLVSLCGALLTSFFLPMPQRSLLIGQLRAPDPRVLASVSGPSAVCLTWSRSCREMGRVLRRLAAGCRECYSSVALLFFCVWSAMGKCGFYQITGYVQILWLSKQPSHNFTAYNGGVDAIATLSGTAASIAVGHIALNWSVWGELVLGLFSALSAGAVYMMDLTDSIWICYACYILFKSVYMQLITICTFQIAKSLSKELYALVFGINMFIGMVLQTLLTAVVLNTKSLQLSLTTQYLIYASYFATIALIFIIRGIYTLLHAKRTWFVDHTQVDASVERWNSLPKMSPHFSIFPDT